MKIISDEIVQEVLSSQADMDFMETERQIALLSREQPALLNYLMGANDERFNFDEKQLLLFIGVNIFQMLSRGESRIVQVTAEDINAAQQKNIDMFEYLEKEIPGEFQKTTDMIFKEYNQKNILRYIIATLFNDDDPHIRADRKGLIFFNLKTVLDCLDQ